MKFIFFETIRQTYYRINYLFSSYNVNICFEISGLKFDAFTIKEGNTRTCLSCTIIFQLYLVKKLCLYLSIRAFLFFFYCVHFRESDQTLTRSTCARYIPSLRFSASFLSTLSFLLNETISLFIHLISSAYFFSFLNKTKKHSFIEQYKEQSVPLKIIKNKKCFFNPIKNFIFSLLLFAISSFLILHIMFYKKKNFITRIPLLRNFSPTDSLYRVFLYYEILF